MLASHLTLHDRRCEPPHNAAFIDTHAAPCNDDTLFSNSHDITHSVLSVVMSTAALVSARGLSMFREASEGHYRRLRKCIRGGSGSRSLRNRASAPVLMRMVDPIFGPAMVESPRSPP